MNAVMAGMIPVMIILMTKYMGAMEPTSSMRRSLTDDALLVRRG